MKQKLSILLCVPMFCSFSNTLLADDGTGYMALQYGSVSVKGKGGKAKSLPSFRLNMFDTSGILTAGMRGAMNQNAAQKAKEYEIQNQVKNGAAAPATYTYSWNQPAPSPTDGDRWIITTATDGSPVIDAISPPSSGTGKAVQSMLGIEYSSAIWTYEAPVTFTVGWGMKFFIFDSSGSGLESSSSSLPINVTFSNRPLSDLIVYADLAVSPIGLAKGTGYYLHEEVGANWNFAGDWLLTLSYRMVSDVLGDKDPKGDYLKYDMTDAYLGVGYQF